MIEFLFSLVKTEITRIHNVFGWSLSIAVMTNLNEKLLHFNQIIDSFTSFVISVASLAFVIIRIYYTIKNKGK